MVLSSRVEGMLLSTSPSPPPPPPPSCPPDTVALTVQITNAAYPEENALQISQNGNILFESPTFTESGTYTQQLCFAAGTAPSSARTRTATGGDGNAFFTILQGDTVLLTGTVKGAKSTFTLTVSLEISSPPPALPPPPSPPPCAFHSIRVDDVQLGNTIEGHSGNISVSNKFTCYVLGLNAFSKRRTQKKMRTRCTHGILLHEKGTYILTLRSSGNGIENAWGMISTMKVSDGEHVFLDQTTDAVSSTQSATSLYVHPLNVLNRTNRFHRLTVLRLQPFEGQSNFVATCEEAGFTLSVHHTFADRPERIPRLPCTRSERRLQRKRRSQLFRI